MKYCKLAIAVSLCVLAAQPLTVEANDNTPLPDDMYNITGENYTYVPNVYTDEEYAELVKAMEIVEKRVSNNKFSTNPELSENILGRVFKNDISKIRSNFNDDGSWKRRLRVVVPVAGKVKTGQRPSAEHTRFFNEVYALAYSYKVGPNGLPQAEIDPSLYQNEEVRELIYKAINWYFDQDISPAPQYRDTFQYSAVHETLAPAMSMVAAMLADEIHEDMATNKLAANVYAHFDDYIGQVIREQPQRRGPNWSGRFPASMNYILFTRNPHRMDEYRHYIDESLTFNEVQSTGMHPDWSMQHHGDMLYWGMYGITWTRNTVRMLGLAVKDTPWDYSERELDFIENALLDGTRWVMYRGNTDYVAAPKRSTTLLERTDDVNELFIDLLKDLLVLGGDRLKRRDEIEFLIENMTPSMDELDKYADNQEMPGHKYFWVTEYQNHRRNNFSIAVKRNSQRTRGPGDSKAKIHAGFGLGYTSILVRGDETRFGRYGWNFMDLPGTTLEQGRSVVGGRAGSIQRGSNLYSGAVTDGLYGAGAFDQQYVDFRGARTGGPVVYRKVNDEDVKLTSLNGAGALKATMFFDDGMVALGQNVRNLEQRERIVQDERGGSGRTGNIWTTLNNKLIRGDVVYSLDNQEPQVIKEGDYKVNAVRPRESMWVWHDNIGYIINKVSNARLDVTLSTQIRPVHEELLRDGSFFQALRRTPYASFADSKTLPMFHLYIDHGQRPREDMYEYLVIMDKTLDEFKEFVEDRNDIHVVKNSKGIQAVQQGEDLYYALFQNPGTVTFADGRTIETRKPMMVMARKTETGYDVTASNPLHTGTRQPYVPGTGLTTGIFYEDGVDITFGGFSSEKEQKSVNFVFPGEPALSDGQSVTHSI